MSKKAVFFDRDGVLNKAIIRNGNPQSPKRIEDFCIIDSAKSVVSELKSLGFVTLVVTNQPDITRKIMTWDELNKMNEYLKLNCGIDEVIVCPHDDKDKCGCRKPEPGMILSAAKKWDIDIKESFFIGDLWRDIDAGRNAGCRTILIDYEYNRELKPDFRAKNLVDAKNIIIENMKIYKK
ncbi:MAG: HAD-IIIA family hydrolase [Elusimicrobiota bacterium]